MRFYHLGPMIFSIRNHLCAALIIFTFFVERISGFCSPIIPCFNGGTCVSAMDFQEPYCRCTEWWTGINCQVNVQHTRIRKTSLLCPNYFTDSCPVSNQCTVDEDCNFGVSDSTQPVRCCKTRCGTQMCYNPYASDLPSCTYSAWQPWGGCSESCGINGLERRSRKVKMNGHESEPESAVGKRCQALDPWDELRTCNLGNCPVKCFFTKWLSWTPCSPCTDNGGGIRTRVKQVYWQGGPWPTETIVGRLCTPKESFVEQDVCRGSPPCAPCLDHFRSCAHYGSTSCSASHSYMGVKSRTVSGRVCQRWDSVFPHFHKYPWVGPHNFCRNPQGNSAPWCYTMEGGHRWEYCFPDCNSPQAFQPTPCTDQHTKYVCAQRAAQGWCHFANQHFHYMRANCCVTCRKRGFKPFPWSSPAHAPVQPSVVISLGNSLDIGK